MSKSAAVSENQMVLKCFEQLVPEGLYPDQDPLARISLARHLGQLSQFIEPAKSPSVRDYFGAEPDHIESALYVRPTDTQFYSAQHNVVIVGVDTKKEKPVLTRDFGIPFPPTEYATVAKSEIGLAKTGANVSRLKSLSIAERNRVEATKLALCSSGNILKSYISAERRLAKLLLAEVVDYRILRDDLLKPQAGRYLAQNLERRRALADEKIHETVEVAGISLELDDAVVIGIQNAVRSRLYKGNYSSTERTYNWLKYLNVIGHYTKAKGEKLEISIQKCERGLETYQPFLDAREEEKRSATAVA